MRWTACPTGDTVADSEKGGLNFLFAVTAYLNRAGLFYVLGIRAFFYSVPLVFWMFGPYFMLGATLGLIAALFPLDRAPRPAISAARLP